LLAELPERLGAAAALVVASPLIFLSAAAVAVLSRKTPWIAHRRVGWRGNTLWMLKLRTMWGPETEGHGSGWIEYIDDARGPERKEADDPRVPNAFARFCRRHSIDELPQLLHVVRGEMSLVGPRPLTTRELRRHYGNDAAEVLEAKPGLAGLWQISGRNRLTYQQRRELDLQLVRGRSLHLYARVLLGAIGEVFSGGNSW
jgi:lipopolysaccharide/colanic/teichoic acid biosynthesis glycosyltransferase